MVTLNVAAPPPPPDGALVGEAAAGAGGEAPYLSSPPQESSRTLKITRPSATKRPQIPSFMSSPFDTRASRCREALLHCNRAAHRPLAVGPPRKKTPEAPRS